MREITPKELQLNTGRPPVFGLSPLQLGMPTPWHVAVASMLLCRTKRYQAETSLIRLLSRWPTPWLLALADDSLELVVAPCGMQRRRARQLRRFSSKYLESWQRLRDLPGVGAYVHDAVGLFCLGLTDLDSNDEVLRAWALSVKRSKL